MAPWIRGSERRANTSGYLGTGTRSGPRGADGRIPSRGSTGWVPLAARRVDGGALARGGGEWC